ncbi:IQ calmodulin-binding motif containing protein [Novymonas esmeraldas]|uniref:IQ calmodulin-binding motif containing protein n=1 Tax=Novymonas esmeraldas TaxID=1808958 RepID=A0AAW0EMY8_9TRYP
MFTQTQPAQVLMQDARHASTSVDKAAAAAATTSSTGAHAGGAVAASAKKGKSDSGSVVLPPIRIHAAVPGTGGAVAAAPPSQLQRPSSRLRDSAQSSVLWVHEAAAALPAVGDGPGRRRSASSNAAASGAEDVSAAAVPVPPPTSAGRPPAPRRRPQASPLRQGRQASVSAAGARADGRSPGGPALRRTRLRSLRVQVESDEAAAGQLMAAGNIGGALMLLGRALESVRDFQTTSGAGRSRASVVGTTASAHAPQTATSPGGSAAVWAVEVVQRLAEVCTTIANNAGLRCSSAAEPIQTQEAFFQVAMRYLVTGTTEDLFPEWSPAATAAVAVAPSGSRSPHPPPPHHQRRRQRTRSTAAPQSAADPPSCFPGARRSKAGSSDQQSPPQPPIVRRLLRCAVRVNAAVCLGDGATQGGQARAIYELLKAVAESDGVWGMAALYNLAVAFVRAGSYDDAAEAVARFMELSWYYLQWAEKVQGEAAAAAAAAAAAVTADMDESVGDGNGDSIILSVAAAVHAHAALQLTRGHQFIAAMAAWCEPHSPVELYHCELACACAARYLGATADVTLDCQRRFAAAQARAAAGLRAAAEVGVPTAAEQAPPPLLLPYVTQELLLSSAPAAGAPSPTRAALSTITMHTLVEALATTATLAASLPAEVRAYVREVQKGSSTKYWASAALSAGAPPPFLSAAVAAAAAAPVPPVLLVLLSHGEDGEGVWARQPSWMPLSTRGEAVDDVAGPIERLVSAATAAGASCASTLALSSPRRSATAASSATAAAPAELTPHRESRAGSGATSPSKPSRPAPLFVTTMPSSAYDRYRQLRDGIVARLESAEHLMEQPDAGDGAPPLSLASETGASARGGSASSRSTATSATPSGGASVAFSRGRRVTALFLGVSSAAATTPATSPALEHRGAELPGALLAFDDGGNDDDVYSTTASAAAAAITLDPTLLAVPVRPSELLRQLDRETEARYSRLVADPLADLQRLAATHMQAWWRTQQARHVRRQRAEAVATRLRCDAAAFRIQWCYRCWRERVPARAELLRRRAERERLRCCTVVQAFVRQHASVNVWGRACVVWYKALVVQREEEERNAAAAVTLQSWWRMHTARRLLCVSLAAARRLQCAWRCTQARRELRARRVHRRLAQEQWRHERLPQIVFVQRWWRATRALQAVGDLLAQKQRAVQEYLAAQESGYDAAMGALLRSCDGVEAAMRCVLGVLAGARDRRRLAGLAAHALVRRRAVLRYVLLWCGHQQLQRLREDRAASLALRRRREEVAVATVKLQRWVRAWLPRRREVHQRARDEYLGAHARTIQTAFRHHRARRGLASGRAQRCRLGAERQRAERQHEAATRIQATWRMHRTRAEMYELFKFMLKDRHDYATAVQRRWRGHYARAVLAPQHEARVTQREARVQQQAVLHCAAVRVQSFYRMYRVRAQLRRVGVSLPCTLMYRVAAARLIQTRWRAYAAHQRVFRLRQQRAYELKQAQAQEALHAYATRIQAVARSYLVRQGRLPVAAPSQPPPPSPPSPPSPPLAAVERAAGLANMYVPRPPPVPRAGATGAASIASGPPRELVLGTSPVLVALPAASPAFSSGGAPAAGRVGASGSADCADRAATPPLLVLNSQAVHTNSALLSCSNSASLSRLTSTTDRPLNFLQSGSTEAAASVHSTRRPLAISVDATATVADMQQTAAASSWTSAAPTVGTDVGRASLSWTERGSNAHARTGVPTSPRDVEGAAEVCHGTPEEVQAAVRIQSAWRGYRVRCTVEFYYEEYYEEIAEEEEDGGESVSAAAPAWDTAHGEEHDEESDCPTTASLDEGTAC